MLLYVVDLSAHEEAVTAALLVDPLSLQAPIAPSGGLDLAGLVGPTRSLA